MTTTEKVIETLEITARELQTQNENPTPRDIRNRETIIATVIFTVGLCLAKILQNIEKKLDDATLADLTRKSK